MTQQNTSQFHDAEIAAQTHAGVAESVAQYSKGLIRGAMPEQHRRFFSELPFVILGLVDQQGYPWTIPLFGPKGFISSPNETQLTINALPDLASLLELDFNVGQKVGLLGIQPSTRRRNRMNGVIDSIDKKGFTIHVEQSFGNCPQYIQTRELIWKKNNFLRKDFRDIGATNHIDSQSKVFIEQADTFFISSRTRVFDKDARSGIDASHRGGKPGFVKVENNTLLFPDFRGNKYFNTLGNILSDDRVGLLFPDYVSGNSIFITGHASILWDDPALIHFGGAERIIKIKAKKVINIPRFLPMTGKLIEYSPTLEHTGQWSHSTIRSIDTYQAFKLTKKQKESDTIISFYFSPANGDAIEAYLPGQFLPMQFILPEQHQTIKRMYTLSSAAPLNGYRISVKREEKGLISRFLHDEIKLGDIVNIGKPAGQFTLKNNNNAVVLLSGGIGITSMIALLEGIIEKIKQGAEERPVYFIHATQNSKTQAFAERIKQLSKQYSWLKIHIVFSQPLDTDQINKTHNSTGRISIALLKTILPSDSYDYYLCGSEGFIQTLRTGLITSGVSTNNIYYEFFGKGSIEASNKLPSSLAERATIRFSKTNLSAEWTPNDGTLLEFAEKQGLSPTHSCRSGSCGACACTLSAGEISYKQSINFEPKKDEVLICCAQPAKTGSEVVIQI